MQKAVTLADQPSCCAVASLHSSLLTLCCFPPSQPSMSMLSSDSILIVFLLFSSANLPPPVSREQLGARILAQERYEQLQVFKRHFSVAVKSVKSHHTGYSLKCCVIHLYFVHQEEISWCFIHFAVDVYM